MENYLKELYSENYFKELYGVDVRGKTRAKNGLNYLAWAAAWAEVKKRHPDANYEVYEQTMEVNPQTGEVMKTRPWFDDGKTAWVKTAVTINGITHTDCLPVLDLRNKPLPAENVTSYDANKSIQRSLTKACARHGLGLYLYEGEDLPEESKELERLREECFNLAQKKSGISDECAKKVSEYCAEADPSGDPRQVEDMDTLRELKTKLMKLKDDAMAGVKKEIIETANALIKSGKKDQAMKAIKEYDQKGNPNAIKDISKAKELLEKLQKIGG